jgi:hypothetical protein
MTGVLAGMIGGMQGPTKPVTAPTSLSAIPTNTNVAISFTAPSNNGGSPITNYEYSFNNSTWTALSPADAVSPVTVSGLTQNTAYTIYLRAVNIFGSGPGSTVLSFTTQGVPVNGPTSLALVSVTTSSATISFTPPSNNGGSAITNYEYSANGGTNWFALSPADDTSPVTIGGLGENLSYAFFLRAVNTYGAGASSATSITITTRNIIPSLEALIIAGGGGSAAGFQYQSCGGAGAGGYWAPTYSNLSGAITVIVGAGGAGATNGSPSQFNFNSVTGGGHGQYVGNSGGSGSGGGSQPPYTGGAGIAGLGGNGGNSASNGAGGGGGAGANGATATTNNGGAGGAGVSSSINGSSVTRAGGGGGGGLSTGGAGGAGGGGAGGINAGSGTATAGSANTGGGAGGYGTQNFPPTAAAINGGSGIIIIAYPTSEPVLFSVSAGLTYSYSSAIRSGYHVYTFTGGSGTIGV